MIRILLVLFFFFIILMFLMGFSVFRTMKNIFSGGEKKNTQRRQTNKNTSGSQRSSRQEYDIPSRKKIFTKDEGEYIEYEEVKDK